MTDQLGNGICTVARTLAVGTQDHFPAEVIDCRQPFRHTATFGTDVSTRITVPIGSPALSYRQIDPVVE